MIPNPLVRRFQALSAAADLTIDRVPSGLDPACGIARQLKSWAERACILLASDEQVPLRAWDAVADGLAAAERDLRPLRDANERPELAVARATAGRLLEFMWRLPTVLDAAFLAACLTEIEAALEAVGAETAALDPVSRGRLSAAMVNVWITVVGVDIAPGAIPPAPALAAIAGDVALIEIAAADRLATAGQLTTARKRLVELANLAAAIESLATRWPRPRPVHRAA